ncbi:MAG: serine hydrolase [Fimbriimonadaceae bacterium]|nr:serine hydrolase [Fimbriimonadaceae bacterium]
MKMKFKPTLLILACAAAAFASADRTSTDVVDQTYLSNATEAQLKDVIKDGYRMIDIEISSTSPTRYTASFVKNTGSYKKSWWWTANRTHAEMEKFIKDHDARALDIEITIEKGKKSYSGTFIKNSGDDKVGWLAFEELDFNQLKKKLDDFDGRVIDLDVHNEKGGRTFSGVMIKNTGAFKKGHVIFSNRSLSEVRKLISDNKMQLTDIERIDSDSFAGVMESNPRAPWWYFVGRSWEQLQQDRAQYNARIVDIERTTEKGKSSFDYILINDCNELETRVGQMMRSGSDGNMGFYVRQVGGPRLGQLMADYRFYPASAIKMLEHMYWTYQVDKNGVSQNTQVRLYANSTNDTHPQSDTFTLQSLIQTQQNMMLPSSNVDANALQDAAGNNNGVTGRAAIMKFAKDILGLDNDIQLNHKLGSGGINSNPSNKMTGRESGLMMEKATNGSVYSPTGFAYLRANMLNETNNSGFSSGLRAIVNQEGAQAGLTQTEINNYWSSVSLIWKGGNNGTAQITSVGHAILPFKSGNRVARKQYVLCAFIERATANTFGAGGASSTLLPELLREEVREGVKGWK